MISQPYNIREFIEAVKDKDKSEIIHLANQEISNVESRSYRVKGAKKAREQGSIKYVVLLKRLLHLMYNRKKPGGISDRDFQLFRPVCESLVQKKQFPPEVMELFEQQ